MEQEVVTQEQEVVVEPSVEQPQVEAVETTEEDISAPTQPEGVCVACEG